MPELTITLNAIRAHNPCTEGWRKLLTHLGKTGPDDEPFPLETVLQSNGIDDALWCLRALPEEFNGDMRMFAVWCARQVQHLMSDERSITALDVAERHAKGIASDRELAAARDAARDAARAAALDAALDAVCVAAWVVVLDAVWAAVSEAAWAAARDAARAAAWDAAWDAAWAAARAAARTAARDAALDAQKNKFIEMCRAGKFV